jgi:hypothetical protein
LALGYFLVVDELEPLGSRQAIFNVKLYSRVSFSVLLPLIDLVIWVVLLAAPATLVFLNLERVAQGSGTAHIQAGMFSASIPRNEFLSFAMQSAALKSSHTVAAANMPGFFGELLLSLPTSWPASWRPAGMMLDTWRAITFPFFCLPAWWLVGLGVDALLKWRRLHWATFLIGTLLFILFGVLFCGLRFALTDSERGEVTYPLWGIGLWSLLFAILPIAWFRQWRSRSACRKDEIENMS